MWKMNTGTVSARVPIVTPGYLRARRQWPRGVPIPATIEGSHETNLMCVLIAEDDAREWRLKVIVRLMDAR